MPDTCPTCGTRVRFLVSEEGTGYCVPFDPYRAEIEAERDTLVKEGVRHLLRVAERNDLRAALERIESHGSGYAVTIAREALNGSEET